MAVQRKLEPHTAPNRILGMYNALKRPNCEERRVEGPQHHISPAPALSSYIQTNLGDRELHRSLIATFGPFLVSLSLLPPSLRSDWSGAKRDLDERLSIRKTDHPHKISAPSRNTQRPLSSHTPLPPNKHPVSSLLHPLVFHR